MYIFDFCWEPRGIRPWVLFFIEKVCTIVVERNKKMGYRTRKKEPFTITERRGKGGDITVIRHNTTGIKTMAVNGKCKTPKGLSNSNLLYNSIRFIGFELLRLFPDLFNQNRNTTIFTYSLPAVEDRDTSRGLRYSFTYILYGGSDIETAISEILPLIPEINQKIESCIEQIKCDDE